MLLRKNLLGIIYKKPTQEPTKVWIPRGKKIWANCEDNSWLGGACFVLEYFPNSWFCQMILVFINSCWIVYFQQCYYCCEFMLKVVELNSLYREIIKWLDKVNDYEQNMHA